MGSMILVRDTRNSAPPPRRPCLAALFLILPILSLPFPQPAQAQDATLVTRMAANEVTARQHQPFFTYISEERSSRTGGHLWREKVVETHDGILRRLLAVDGVPLNASDRAAEQRRIDAIVADPDAFRKLNEARKDDEERATQLLQFLPTAYIITPDSERDGCTAFRFRPNPAFQPQDFEQRVLHAMSGTVSLRQPMDRLCGIEATIAQPVNFGFGLLGSVDSGGHLGMERRQIAPGIWKTDHISVHVNGRVLLFKSIARNQETTRADIAVVPPNLTLAQAAQLTAR